MQKIEIQADTSDSVKIVWLSDTHMAALKKEELDKLFALVKENKPDIVLIGGDICNGPHFLSAYLEKIIACPFYFILGNHDFYYGSIEEVKKRAQLLAQKTVNGNYLTDLQVVHLAKNIALIGHDGWADGRAGDFMQSNILLNDYFCIQDLKNLSKKELLEKLNKLGDEAAAYFKKTLNEACASYKKVIILTHAPPFEEVCRYKEDLICDPN